MLTDLIHQSGIEVHRINIDTDAQMLNVLNVNQYSCVCVIFYIILWLKSQRQNIFYWGLKYLYVYHYTKWNFSMKAFHSINSSFFMIHYIVAMWNRKNCEIIHGGVSLNLYKCYQIAQRVISDMSFLRVSSEIPWITCKKFSTSLPVRGSYVHVLDSLDLNQWCSIMVFDGYVVARYKYFPWRSPIWSLCKCFRVFYFFAHSSLITY